MRKLLLALLLLPSAGFAQTLAVTVNGAGTGLTTTPVLAYNASGCGFTVAGNWVGSGLTAACTSLQIWVTASSCGTVPSTTNVPADVIVYTAQAGDLANGLTTDSFSFAFNLLPGFTTNACGSVVDFTNTLCAAVTTKAADLSCTGTVAQASTVSLRYDNVPPLAPTLTVVPLDSQLSVRLAPTDSTDTILYYQVQYALQPADGGTPSYISIGGNIPANNPVVTISNLTNDQPYLITGTAQDEATNISAPSTPVVASPVVTLGFYQNYIDDGGQPAGGCGNAAVGAPSALAFATVLLLLGLARRRG
jgi:hypothetical protein